MTQTKKPTTPYSSDELDQLIELTTPTKWFAWIGVIGLFSLLIGWSFYGQVSETLTAKGIINQPNKTFVLTSKTSGIIQTVEPLTLHKNLKKNTVIATVSQPALQKEIKALEIKLKELSRFYKSIYKKKSASAKLESEKLTYEIKLSKRKIKLLKTELKTSSMVSIPLRAKIQELFIKKGRFINLGDPIAYIEKDLPKNQIATVYFTAEQIKKLTVNNEILLAPATIDTNKYGYLIGTISEISPHKSYGRLINSDFKNTELSNWINNTNALYKATISLKHSPDTTSGFAWTVSTGPPFEIGTDILCNAKLILKKSNPIARLLSQKIKPFLQKHQ